MENSGFVLYRQGDPDADEDENVWDDTALIRAYDKAVKVAKEKVAAKLGFVEGDNYSAEEKTIKTESSFSSPLTESGKKIKSRQWKAGDYCRAVYSEDGEVYEGVLVSVDKATASCIVRYIGYENEEEKSISELLPSSGAKARQKQQSEAQDAENQMDDSERLREVRNETPNQEETSKKEPFNIQNANVFLPNFGSEKNLPIPPPPPPSLWPNPPQNPQSSESLYSMLMAWYMAGYHTGLYQGQQMSQSQGSNPQSGSRFNETR